MPEERSGLPWKLAVASLFFVPVAHPLLLPLVGVPSHLLWWVHVLPVALLTFRGGRRAAALSLVVSGAFVAGGEALFGGGYGFPAATETALALTVALTATNLLVVVFALYARGASSRYRLLFNRVGMGVVQTDARGEIMRANPAALVFLGLGDIGPLLGKHVLEVIRSAGLTSMEELEAKGGWSGEIEVRTGGSARTRHALVAAARDPDTDGYQVLLADRSTEAMQEQEIERQVKLASLGEALAGVAHELRNPLTTILAHAQLGAMDAPEGSQLAETFDVIQHDAKRMNDLISELLGFSRTSEGGACADIGEVIGRVARVQRIALGKRIEIAEDAQWTGSVRASAVKIEQILLNLISNSAYSVAKSGGSKITIGTRLTGTHVEVEVADDGAGIDPSIADRLFEPFLTTKPEGEGTGLGLAISRRLARGWDGDLTVRNVSPRGAAFTLSLRLPDASVKGGDCASAGGEEGRTAGRTAGRTEGRTEGRTAGRTVDRQEPVRLLAD